MRPVGWALVVAPSLVALPFVALSLVALSGCAPQDGELRELVILPDTQCYTVHDPEIFVAQGDFLLAGTELGLSYDGVIHLGDITQDNTAEQWALARNVLGRAYLEMPVALAPGNHDLGAGGGAQNRVTGLEAFFDVAHVHAGVGFVDAFEGGVANTAWEIPGAIDLLLVALEFAPRAAVRAWASEVLARFPAHVAIVSTHAYLDRDGRRYDSSDAVAQEFCPHDYPVGREDGADGEQLFREVFAPSPNVRLVLCGHVPRGWAHSSDLTDDGATVHQVLVDYQDGTECLPEGGDGRGYLLRARLLTMESGVEIQLEAYSPWEGRARSEHRRTLFLSAPR